ncbi:hypothetical protein HB848_00465 [Listeria rocourtiae]|uniref:DUF6414 family protein n=1 Tax=Listeria rocourtiae TaxID=647910 RepID=UPI0016236FE6|nr:DUF6414 family protein [Listeria rocourtiae]MBC1433808.1 hypothetical protein [Listeria rocourtiae]
MIKVVYFDEGSASDYIVIQNGGQIDWSKKENKEKLAKILTEIDVQAKGGFNLLSLAKVAISGSMQVGYDATSAKMAESTITNTLLTDYIEFANEDTYVKKFHNKYVYAPENSVSMYKMYSSYLNVVPKDQMPIDLGELNNAILGERGYYQMLVSNDDGSKQVLRFNINTFKNGYTLADLSKMNLSFFGVNVGTCVEDDLSMENEFKFESSNKKPPSAQEVVKGIHETDGNRLKIFDIVLAGVMHDQS